RPPPTNGRVTCFGRKGRRALGSEAGERGERIRRFQLGPSGHLQSLRNTTPNDNAQQPVQAEDTAEPGKPLFGWPACCSFWFAADPLANILEQELAIDLDLGRGLAPVVVVHILGHACPPN